MAKFRGVEIVKDIRKALDRGQAQFVTNTQSKLSASAPVASGRLASSWFVGKGNPNRKSLIDSEPWKSWKEGNRPTIETEQYSDKITFDGDWWLSSNLPYSERAALDPRWSKGGRIGGTSWFTSVVNNLNKDADRIFQRELKKVK